MVVQKKGSTNLQQSLWWRGPVTIEKNQIIPPGEQDRVAYNPFEFYFPYTARETRRQRSLYHVFDDVDVTDIHAVADFCSQYGVLGNSEMTWEEWNRYGSMDPDLLPLDQYLASDSLSQRMETKSRSGLHPLRLLTPISLDDFQLEHSAMKEVLSLERIAKEKRSKKDKAQARERIQERLAGELTKISPRLVWQNTRWISHWDTLSLVGVMYLMLFFDLQGPGTTQTCKRCGRFFLSEHGRSLYCSSRCRNTAKVARFRKNKKRKEQRNTSKG